MKNEYLDVMEPIQYSARRCWTCGSFWAVETRKASDVSGCPVCLTDEVKAMRRRAEKAERAVRALKSMRKGKKS